MPFLRKYNTLTVTGTTAIRIPIIKRAVVDFAVSADWTPAAGDVKIAIDGAAAANVTNLPTAVAMGNTAYWDFVLTAAELTCKSCVITIADSATKAVEDQSFLVETFGNASAMYQADLSAANLPANVVQLLGTAWLTPAVAGTPDVNAKQWNGLTTVALPLIPTTAGRTLDVSATGEAGLDWANIGSPTTAVNLSATNIDVDQIVASVSGAVGSVTGAVGSIAAGGIASTSFAAGAIDAAAIATDAIGSAELAASAIAEIQAGLATPTNITAATGIVLSGVTHTGAVIPTVTTVTTTTNLTTNSDKAGYSLAATTGLGNQTANITGNLSGSVGSVAVISTGAITTASFAAGAINAAAIATDAIGSDELSDAAVTKITLSPPGTQLATVLNQQILQDTLGRLNINYGTIGSVGNTSTTVHLELDFETNELNDQLLTIRDNSAARTYARWITAYNATTKVATVDHAYPFTPQNGVDTFAIFSIKRDERVAEIGVAGAGLSNINLPNQIMDIIGNITGNVSGSVGSVAVISSAAITTASFAAGAINAAAIATDAIGSDELAASAIAEIQSGLATPTNITAGTITTVTTLTNLPAITANWLTATGLATSAVDEISDQVWDEILSGHAIVGSTGAALAAAGGSGDPWATALPGAYGAGSAGKIIGDNVNATITSRMATYVQPSGFLAATFPAIVASTTNITAASGITISGTTQTLDTLQTALNAAHGAGSWVTATGFSTHSAADVWAVGARTLTAFGFTVTTSNAADVTAILADTNELQTDWVNGGRLDNILDARSSQTSVDDIPTNAELATALGLADDAVLAAIAALNNLSAAAVNAEVLDVMNVDTFSELAAPPAATSSLRDKLTWLFMWARNKSTETATQRKLFADNTTTVVSTEAVSDDATTFTKGEAS